MSCVSYLLVGRATSGPWGEGRVDTRFGLGPDTEDSRTRQDPLSNLNQEIR